MLTKEYEESYEVTVPRGAERLNQHFGGTSWRKRVDKQKLNMGSPHGCLLAQLFGEYNKGMEELFKEELPKKGSGYDYIFTFKDLSWEHGFHYKGVGGEKILKTHWLPYLEES